MRTIIIIIVFTLAAGIYPCCAQLVSTVIKTTQKDTATEFKKTKIYILKKQATNADFDYSRLNNIDSNVKDTINTKNLMAIFEPVSGIFNYYQFIATFKGEGFNDNEKPIIKIFHDILIIKTNKNNKIIDAFQYTLEWAELPLQYDLFKSSAKNIILKSGLNISQLKLMRTYGEYDKELKESGIIKLK